MADDNVPEQSAGILDVDSLHDIVTQGEFQFCNRAEQIRNEFSDLKTSKVSVTDFLLKCHKNKPGIHHSGRL